MCRFINRWHSKLVMAISEVFPPRSVLVFDHESGKPSIVQYGVAVAVHSCRKEIDYELVSVVLYDVLGEQFFVVLIRRLGSVRVAMDARAIRITDRHAAMFAPRVTSRFSVIL